MDDYSVYKCDSWYEFAAPPNQSTLALEMDRATASSPEIAKSNRYLARSDNANDEND